MNDEERLPFWAEPPYVLLTDVLQLDKIEPWNVDVGKLVTGLLQEMKRFGDIDFRVSGNALYSAAVIFMKKTLSLVELGLIKTETNTQDNELVIPMIRPPFRLTNRRVTLQELLLAMDRVLSKGVRGREPAVSKRTTRRLVEPLSLEIDSQETDVEDSIEEVYRDLCKMIEMGAIARLEDILVQGTRTEIVRVFLALLHLYARRLIDITIDENETIWIKILPRTEEIGLKTIETKTGGATGSVG